MQTLSQVMSSLNEKASPLGLLHIDDNAADTLMFKTTLKNSGGDLRLVASASTLAEGLHFADDDRIDCIVAKLALPDRRGLDVVSTLIEHFPGRPLIVLTDAEEGELARHAIRAGAQDTLAKEQLGREGVLRVVTFAVERMRLHARQDEARRRMQQELRHKERVLQLARKLHKVRNLDAFMEELKTHFHGYFEAGQFSLFAFKPSAGWVLAGHNHADWSPAQGESRAMALSGVMAECVSQGKPIAYKHMRSSPYGSPNAHRYTMDNAISLPLRVDDQIVGVLNLNDNPNDSFEDESLANIAHLSEHLGLALFNVLSYEEYQGLAHCDGLTGLFNRWYLHRQLPQEINRSRRYGLSLSAIVGDIDHFKQVNDTHGHPVGDMVLTAFARLMVKMVRDSDLVFRIGGEEFLILLPNTSGKDAMTLAERIRTEWSRELFLTTDSKTFRSTASFGICELPKLCEMDAFLAFADRALYRAKQNGRNRCILH